MKTVFVDTQYLIAVTNSRDAGAAAARAARKELNQALLITTDEVLTEFLNYFSARGRSFRVVASDIVRAIRRDPNMRVVEQTRQSFESGHGFYDAREDKEYSLTDCISMELMRTEGITEVLSNDHHFEQEGFRVLMRE